jgi:hypothetical protein
LRISTTSYAVQPPVPSNTISMGRAPGCCRRRQVRHPSPRCDRCRSGRRSSCPPGPSMSLCIPFFRSSVLVCVFSRITARSRILHFVSIYTGIGLRHAISREILRVSSNAMPARPRGLH